MPEKRRQNLQESLQRFRTILNEQEIEELLAIQERSLPTGIRFNPLKVTPEEAVRSLSDRYGWKVAPIPFCTNGWTIRESQISPGTTIEHRMGHYYLQDAASMVPVSLFDLDEPHPLVLDMAASPGGKTTHLIDRTDDQGLIIANDASKGRIPALRSVLSIWGAANTVITNFPGETFGDWYPDTFDMVLLDSPCSMENLRPVPGRPLRETSSDERFRLQDRQIQLLTSGLKALKPGGQLVYATCSLAPEEDEAVIDALLDAYPNTFEIIDVSHRFKFRTTGLTNFEADIYDPHLSHALRLWPHLTGMSGFFCALLVKTSSIATVPTSPPSRSFSRTDLGKCPLEIRERLEDQVFKNYGISIEVVVSKFSLDLYQRYDQLFLIPTRYLSQFITLPYEFIGLPLGRWVKDKFEPSHEFISRFGHQFTRGIIQINDQQVISWVAGRDIRHPEVNLVPEGQYLLVTDNADRNLGMGKLLPKRLRNMLPRGSV